MDFLLKGDTIKKTDEAELLKNDNHMILLIIKLIKD